MVHGMSMEGSLSNFCERYVLCVIKLSGLKNWKLSTCTYVSYWWRKNVCSTTYNIQERFSWTIKFHSTQFLINIARSYLMECTGRRVRLQWLIWTWKRVQFKWYIWWQNGGRHLTAHAGREPYCIIERHTAPQFHFQDLRINMADDRNCKQR